MSTPIQGYERNAVYVDVLSNFTDRTPPESAKAGHLIDFGISPTHQREERQHKTGNRNPRPQIQRKRSHDFNLNTYLEPSGTPTVPPRMGAVLEGALGAKNDASAASATVKSTPAPTATSFTLDSIGASNIDDFDAGGIIKIEHSDGNTYYRAIVSISGEAGADKDVTISPALPTAPSAGDAITGGINYSVGADIKPLSICADLENGMEFAHGALPNTFAVEFSGAGDVMIEASGPVREGGFTYVDQVGTGGIDDSATTLPIKNNVKNFSVGSYIQVESEVMLVTALDEGNSQVTVVRAQASTSAAAHAADIAINAYVPTPTIVGEPLAGSVGSAFTLKLGSTEFTPIITKVRAEGNNNASVITDEVGSGTTGTRYTQGRADFTVTVGIKLEGNQIPLLNQHSGDTIPEVEFLCWLGEAAGKVFVMYAPRGEMQLVSIPSSGDEEIHIEQPIRLLPGDSGQVSSPLMIAFF